MLAIDKTGCYINLCRGGQVVGGSTDKMTIDKDMFYPRLSFSPAFNICAKVVAMKNDIVIGLLNVLSEIEQESSAKARELLCREVADDERLTNALAICEQKSRIEAVRDAFVGFRDFLMGELAASADELASDNKRFIK